MSLYFAGTLSRLPRAPLALAGASPLLFTIKMSGVTARAPPCSPNHAYIFQAAGGTTGVLSRDFLIPLAQLHFCCVMVGRGDSRRQMAGGFC